MIDEANILKYTFNFFAFPDGYFEQHTAEELKVSEEERQELIRLQSTKNQRCSVKDREEGYLKEFVEDLSE